MQLLKTELAPDVAAPLHDRSFDGARSFAMNRVLVQCAALLAAAILAMPALGQTNDQVACYYPHTDVRLSNIENIVLGQNSPNPFAEQTTITYTLPGNAKKAQMRFFDAKGKLIRAVDIASRSGQPDVRGDEDAQCAGGGRVVVFANDLRDGLYTYALVVDGRVVDSKRMVKCGEHGTLDQKRCEEIAETLSRR